MKALKNDSILYTQKIVSAINACYERAVNPSNTELMELYAFIGQGICEQGEKAFVVHLAQALAEQLPQINGFSPRNLRRMRDFYRTYQNQPELMRKAQALGWTQNAVILDCCETEEQRSFYIALAAEKNLSKLTLMKAIDAGDFETAQAEEAVADACPACCPAVGDIAAEEAVDTSTAIETACGAFVTACEQPRQGRGLPCDKMSYKTGFGGKVIDNPPKHLTLKNEQEKRNSRPTPKRSVELLPSLHIYIDQIGCWLQLQNKYPKKHTPPRWLEDTGDSPRSICFA